MPYAAAMASFDVIVIGAGVIGTSVAWHLAALGAGRVLVLDRGQIGAGTTAQSSGILRTHYSVAENVDLARRSWRVFEDFAAYLGDEDASAGLVRCGYLIAAPEGDKLEPLRASLAAQQAMGIPVELLNAAQAAERLPICRFDDAALIGFEPEAGFADAYLVTTSFARAARRRGVKIIEGVEVQRLLLESGKVSGVDTSQGRFDSPVVVSAQNIWATDIERWTGIATPAQARAPHRAGTARPAALHLRHAGLQGPGLGRHAVLPQLRRATDAGQRRWCRQTLSEPDHEQGDVPMDYVVEVGAQAAERFPSFETAGLASSWTGVYDVTPDWNPVLGALPEVPGLVVGYGFSGHGFKLSPMVGRVLAQAALGLSTDVPLAPYALERFRGGRMLSGRYGSGAVS